MSVADEVSLRAVTPRSDDCFFGYYHDCPWDGSGRFMLSLRVPFTDRLPDPGDRADVCLVDTEDGDRLEPVSTTAAWNFQLGAMLQWVGPDWNRFLFNDRSGGSFVARICGRDGELRQSVPHPVYTVDPAGTSALSVSFERLHQTRKGYGYPKPALNSTSLEDRPDDDGVFLLNLDTGNSELILSFEDLAARNPLPSMEDGAHWVNHLSYSPSGQRVAFLHRWSLNDGGMYTRLYTMSSDGDDLRCVIDSGMVSHYCWRSDEEIVGWARRESAISDASGQGRFDLPVVREALNLVRQVDLPSWIRQNVIGDRYYRFSVLDGECRMLGPDVLDEDGHPSFSDDGRWLLTDTYPDENDDRSLLLFDAEAEEVSEIALFHSPPSTNQTPWRCDLHPRWSRDGTRVSIDSMHEGRRRMYVLDLAEIVSP